MKLTLLWFIITVAFLSIFFYESYTGWHEFHDLFFGLFIVIFSTATILLKLSKIENKLEGENAENNKKFKL